MNNSDVAAALGDMAEILELKGESSFRIRAYDNAARAIGALTEDVRALRSEGRLTEVKGIGKGIASAIDELLDSGHIDHLEELRREFPDGVRALMRVPGVGPSLARRVYQELQVTNLEELRAAAEDGRLATLPGLGEKSAQNVLRALDRVNKQDSRISMGKAIPVVEELIEELRQADVFNELVPAGSLRRWAPTIGDIDLMATSPDPAKAMAAFVGLPQVRQVLGHGATKSSILTDNGLQIDLRIVDPESFGSLVQHFTGSKAHNIELRDFALRRGLSINEYGVTSVADGTTTPYADEHDVYAALQLDFIPPELREGRGEIEAARTHSLPALVKVEDIKGDLHAHTQWSDGANTIEEMILSARERGYQYVAITDHSGGIGVAHGLSVDRLQEQLAEIRKIAEGIDGIEVLTGSEVEIKRDGSLDFPDHVLEQLDFVVASVHSGFNQSEEEMTRRIVTAMENPHVDAIGHPTGRLIGKREPYAVDLEAMFRAAARTKTALEINSFPERLDLVDTHARRAKDLGVMLVVNTDAHAPVHFDNMRFGIAMARRAWAEASNVLNALPYGALKKWLRPASP